MKKFLWRRNRPKQIYIFLAAFALISGGIALLFVEPENAGDVKLYDTSGLTDSSQWKRIRGTTHVFDNPEHIVFENANFRVTYPFLRDNQLAGHSYFVNINGAWQQVTGNEYGDYVYFVDSICKPPEKVTIKKNTPDEVILSFVYRHKNYNSFSQSVGFYQGDILLTKIMSLKKGYSGVFVKLKSLPVNPDGEREIGFGADSPLVFSEQVIAQHPVARYHVNLNMEQTRWQYGVSLPLNDSFYRLLVLSRPMWTMSYQFEPDRGGGRLTVNHLNEHDSDTYEAFLGAIPFDSRQSAVECETARNVQAYIEENKYASGGKLLKLGNSGLQQVEIPVNIPADGKYRLALRYRTRTETGTLSATIDDGDNKLFDVLKKETFDYLVVAEQQDFSAGEHHVTVNAVRGDVELDTLLALPILSPRRDFPLDVAAKVFPEMIAPQSLFEGETLFYQTGRNIEDAAAANRLARCAIVNDAPGFLTFGPYYRIAVAGKYRATFYLKVQENATAETLANLEVFSDIAGVITSKSLIAKDFPKHGVYQSFSLDFTIPPTYPQDVHRVEFRVIFTGKADVCVDDIELR